jgi:hypothetical protein
MSSFLTTVYVIHRTASLLVASSLQAILPGANLDVKSHLANVLCFDSNQRTRNQFRPRTTGKGGATSYQLRQYAEATLGGGSLRKVVKLPEGEDENEWLAVNSEDPDEACIGKSIMG